MRQIAWIQASTQLRNSSPKPVRRSSYQAYASLRSCSVSEATINLAAIAAAHPSLDFFPGESGGRVIQEVGFATSQLLLLPIMDWDGLGSSGKVIPEILNQLKLLRRTQIKYRSRIHVRFNHTILLIRLPNCSLAGGYQSARIQFLRTVIASSLFATITRALPHLLTNSFRYICHPGIGVRNPRWTASASVSDLRS